jgi:hypothetical protein
MKINYITKLLSEGYEHMIMYSCLRNAFKVYENLHWNSIIILARNVLISLGSTLLDILFQDGYVCTLCPVSVFSYKILSTVWM